jgi:hypothetical protein
LRDVGYGPLVTKGTKRGPHAAAAAAIEQTWISPKPQLMSTPQIKVKTRQPTARAWRRRIDRGQETNTATYVALTGEGL